MAVLLLQLNLCLVLAVQLTSSQSTYDVSEDENDVINSCDGRTGYLVSLISQQQTALSQLQHVASQLLTAVSQMHRDVSQLQTGVSQLQRDVAELKTDDRKNLSADCVPILIQQNVDGSNFFNRSWAEFEVGFAKSNGNYWIGNERLSQLTMSGLYKLRFELEETNGTWYWAEYSTFRVKNETYNYQLQVSGYSGNTGRDALGYSNGMKFTTYDRDNDQWSRGNCAEGTGGGFWYDRCAWCHVNGQRGRGDGFTWRTGSHYMLLKTSRMLLSCH